ncbi:alpha-L-rhamnosidase [Paenibacillaceae bacterium GAS479]|nr:alpha-L-rhamnosidase [Paenibacillaceae bacterium GAS479]
MNSNQALSLAPLSIDGWEKPIGVDPEAMQFRWQLVCERRGVTQKSCQISLFPLESDGSHGPELWNSGVSATSMPFFNYDGPQLQSHQAYGWKLRVWEENASEPAEAEAAFVSGLSPHSWNADWIWKDDSLQSNQFAYFRKEYVLEQPATTAYLSISAHHYFQLFINGTRVGGYVSPAPSDPLDGKLYVTYDITSFLAPDGNNCLAVMALYLGDKGQNTVDGFPGLIVQGDITLQDGSKQRWTSGTDWQHLSSGAHRSGTAFQQSRRISPIEEVDARVLSSSWTKFGFKEQKSFPVTLSSAADAGWRLTPQRIPEGVIDDTIMPKLVHSVRTDEGLCQIFDTGRIISGWVRLSLRGVRDVKVRMRYAEQLDENGNVERKVCNEKSENYYDEYTMRGDAWEEWAPAFTYKAFRFVELTGYPDVLQNGELTVIAARTGLPELGSFRSSDPFLNALHEASIRTQKNNILGQVVDCPHREQAQYLADTDLQAELLLYHFGFAAEMLEKTLTDFTNAQKPDGAFPFVAPTNDDDPGFAIRIPEWDLHFISLLWKVYQISGDTSLITRHYSAAKRSAELWLSLAQTDGLLPKSEWWHISDWPYPIVDESGSVLTVQNTKFYQALRLLEQMSTLAGSPEDSAHWRAAADKLSVSIGASLFDLESNGFMDSLDSQARHQGVNALAYLAGLTPASADHPALLKQISEQQWEARTVLSLPLLRLLFEEGFPDKAYSLMHRTEYPGWGYMIAQGSPTLWEGWDDKESHSHAWNGYPARMLSEYIVGIQSAAPGLATIRFQPYCPEELLYTEASVPTPFGMTRAKWEQQQDGLTINIDVPAGAKAELWLTPLTQGRPIEGLCIYEGEGGAEVLIWSHDAIQNLDHTSLLGGERLPEAVIIRFGSGQYRFTTKSN